jgi:Skp family chaperone for outer membrane proteins
MRKLRNARWFSSFVIAGAILLGAASLSYAQQVDSRIFTLNQDQLYSQSLFGKRVVAEIAMRKAAIVEENTRMEAELTSEELALTKKRPTLTPAAFRLLADAFDAKVEKIRTGRAQKSLDLTNWSNDERKRFFLLAFPILLQYARDIGALVILDRRSVVISFDQIDITAAAIEKIDTAIKDGATVAKE